VGPKLLDDHVRFRLDLADPAVTGVVLQCDRVVGGRREFRRDAAGWVLDVPRPALQRLEYRFAVARGEDIEVVLDPVNPCSVRTAFGDRSVLELPGYTPPLWLSAPTVEGRMEAMSLAGGSWGDTSCRTASELAVSSSVTIRLTESVPAAV